MNLIRHIFEPSEAGLALTRLCSSRGGLPASKNPPRFIQGLDLILTQMVQ